MTDAEFDPDCSTCDGDSYIDVLDDEGFGVIGPAPCPKCCGLDTDGAR